jgi:hypothetical protein
MSALSFEDDPVLVEVDSRIFDLIRDLTILAATALQIATGGSTGRLDGFDAPMYQTAENAVTGQISAPEKEME